MLYEIAHVLRDRFPFLWDAVDGLNGWLFALRYGQKLKGVHGKLGECCPQEYDVILMKDCPTEELVAFFSRQPEEAFTYFRPHGFDAKSLHKLQQNRAFLGYVLKEKNSGRIAGYCFNRSFFHGKGFRGRMVDVDFRGRGLGTRMNRLLNEVGFGIGLKLFETVSKHNVASYRSALSASKVRILEEMEGDDLFLEILPD